MAAGAFCAAALLQTLIGLALLVGMPARAAAQDLRLATTTSTENSGLLRAILPRFETKFHIQVHVIAVGTGKSLKLGENGDADVLLVAGTVPVALDDPVEEVWRAVPAPRTQKSSPPSSTSS